MCHHRSKYFEWVWELDACVGGHNDVGVAIGDTMLSWRQLLLSCNRGCHGVVGVAMVNIGVMKGSLMLLMRIWGCHGQKETKNKEKNQ